MSALVLFYHQSQQTAMGELAMRVPLPEATVIQQFDAATDVNDAGEFRLLTEVRPEKHVMVNIGTDSTPEILHITPLYPISEQAMLAIFDLPGMEKFGFTRFSDMNTPVAVAVQDEHMVSGELLAQGDSGPVIEIVGAAENNPLLAQAVRDALGENGIIIDPNILVVNTYAHGRAAAFASPDYQSLVWKFAVLGMVFLMLGSWLHFSRQRKASYKPHVEYLDEVPALGNLPAVRFEQSANKLQRTEPQSFGRRLKTRIDWIA